MQKIITEVVMKNKCIILTITFFLIMLSGVYSQSNESSSEEELPALIFERDWWHYSAGITFNQYQYLDGTLLKYSQVRSIISPIPGNDELLRQERGWFVSNVVFGILTLSSYIGWTVYNFDLPNTEIMRPTFLFTGITSLLVTAISNDVWKHKLRKTINNYNVYIQGIPIIK
ncbi:MAG: hypothetical protein LBK73_08175 [Treponema sp.]|jgi:hypothetical protein|nr:hypothetical protein [Treponema sp.]